LQGFYKKIFNSHYANSDSFIKKIWQNYPCSSLTITVFIGVYEYDGAYWTHFEEKTGCTNHEAWKECMFEEIKKRNLPIFDEFGSQKYVSTILGHAGIPNKSLDGFIHGFIQPAIEHGLKASEAIDYLVHSNEDSVIKTYMLHKNVIDYLKTGGKVVEDFVDRCMQLLADTTETETDVSSFNGYLPRRILKKFSQLKKENLLKLNLKHRLIPPVLKIDPIIEGIYIKLPVQRSKQDFHPARWLLKTSVGSTTVVETDTVHLKTSNSYEYVPQLSRIHVNPGTQYELCYEIDGHVQQSWRFDTSRYLVFNSETREEIKRHQTNHGGYWIVINDQYKPKPDAHITPQLTYQRLHGKWGSYYLWEVDAKINTLIHFFNHEGDCVDIPVIATKGRPYLTGGQMVCLGSSQPAFNSMPILCLPIDSFPDFKEDIHYWTLTVSHHYSAYREEYRLSNYINSIKQTDDHYEIDLEQMIKNRQFGNYELRLTGLLGSDARLSFILLPSIFQINGLTQPEFPTKDQGYTVQNFRLSLDRRFSLISLYPTHVKLKKLQVLEDKIEYNVFIPTDVNKAIFQLTNAQTEEIIELEFLPKALSWGLYRDGKLEKANQVIEIDEIFLSHHNDRLRVVLDLTNLKQLIKKRFVPATLMLIDEYGDVCQSFTHHFRVGKPNIVPINPFIETIKHAQTETCHLWIQLGSISQTFCLLKVSKKRELNNIIIEEDELNGNLCIRWEESYPLPNRILRIWNEWYPWDGYEEYKIPDETNEITIPWIKKPTGSYLFEWDIKKKKGLFDFLNKTFYPSHTASLYRWHYQLPTAPKEQLINFIFGKGTLYECDEKQLGQELILFFNGAKMYGEEYVKYLQNYLHKWRSLAKRFPAQVKEVFNVFHNQERIKQGLKQVFVIYEWPIDQLCTVDDLFAKHYFGIKPHHQNEFGQTAPDIQNLFDKPKEALHELYQYMGNLNEDPDQLDIRLIIIDFALRCKNDADYLIQVKKLVSEKQMEVRELIEYMVNQRWLTDEVLDLLKLRWINTDVSTYLNFPYYVAVVALGLRMISQYELPFSHINLIREMENTMVKLANEWLLHDLIFIEKWIKLQQEVKGDELKSNYGD
jgi:hypothetical protein